MKHFNIIKRLVLTTVLVISSVLLQHSATLQAQSPVTCGYGNNSTTFDNCLSGAGGTPQKAVVVDINGNVGIGTLSPAEKLHVVSDYLRVDGNGNQQAIIGSGVVSPTDTVLASFNPSVKVGSSNPAVKWVQMMNTGLKLPMGLVSSHVVVANLLPGRNNAPVWFLDGAGTQWQIGLNQYNGNGDFSIGQPSTAHMTFKTNGTIGIGTTDPVRPLHINTTASSGGAILISNPTNGQTSEASIGFVDADGPAWGVGVGGYATPDKFFIGSTSGPKMMFNDNGNVGIGTTDPQRALHINTTASSGGAILISNPTNGQTSEASIGFTDADGPAWGVGVGGYATPNTFFIGSTSGPKMMIGDDGIVSVKALQITGGADLAEPFNMTNPSKIEPGMVVAIDPDHPGQLHLAKTAYDRMVAGVVSGAGGVNSGLIMQQEGTAAVGEHPVALTGRVYVWVDATKAPVNPGDMLTTSDTPGHAMKVADYQQAQGAILGKAMSKLATGKGLVLVLVTLQ